MIIGGNDVDDDEDEDSDDDNSNWTIRRLYSAMLVLAISNRPAGNVYIGKFDSVILVAHLYNCPYVGPTRISCLFSHLNYPSPELQSSLITIQLYLKPLDSPQINGQRSLLVSVFWVGFNWLISIEPRQEI